MDLACTEPGWAFGVFMLLVGIVPTLAIAGAVAGLAALDRAVRSRL